MCRRRAKVNEMRPIFYIEKVRLVDAAPALDSK
jgi:hypothetical protein